MNKLTENPMRVLVGIYRLDHIGGAELYTYDLLNELRKQENVEVEFFAVHQGQLAERVKSELGVQFMSRDQYDLILATHNLTVEAIHDRGPVVQICHGAILELEQPSFYADYHVGITEEVCESLTKKGYPNELVLNGLDIHQKYPINEVNEELKVVLSLCQSEEANELLAKACSKKGVKFIHFNKFKNPTFDIEHEINRADLVVGIGRSVYDAMACGRPCIVFDSRDYNNNKADGYLEPELFDKFVRFNCSGRYRNLEFDENDLVRELEKYNPGDGKKLREITMEKLNVEQTAKELLATVNHIPSDANFWKNVRIFKWKFKKMRKSIKRKFKKLLKK